MEVLLVANEKKLMDLFEVLLAERGHLVVRASEFGTALEAFWNHNFSLAIVDLGLADGNGPKLCHRIRRLEAGARSVILAVAGRKQLDDVKAVVDAGVDDYIVEPFDLELARVRLEIAERKARRTDALSLLNLLRVGVAMTDTEGKATFLSKTFQSMMGRNLDEVLGHSWEDMFSVSEEYKNEIRRMIVKPRENRARVPVCLQTADGQKLWLEIDIQDDPRNSQRRIFFIYDASELYDLRRLIHGQGKFRGLIGRSALMQRIFEQIRRVAAVDSTVLIRGETGTGKELVARAIHMESARKDKPFIAVNCAGLTEALLASQLFGHKRGAFTGAISDQIGVFESAEGGTLFLDEIGDIPMSVQMSLLRVLQEREITRLGEARPRKVNVRILVATHHDLEADVQAGVFRQDLLYRIKVARVELPPLRERRDDIPFLIRFFLEEGQLETGKRLTNISQTALQALLDYHWPGNVRELKSAIDFATIHADGEVIHFRDLPSDLNRLKFDVHNLSQPSIDSEETLLLDAIDRCRGNRAEAARVLGIGRSTLYRRLTSLGISTKESRRKPFRSASSL